MAKTRQTFLSGLTRYFQVYQEFGGKRMYFLVFLSILSTLTEGIGISLFVPFLDSAGGQGGADSKITPYIDMVFGALSIERTGESLLLLIVAVFVVKGALKLYEGWMKARILSDIVAELRARILRAFFGMRYEEYLRHNTGTVTNLVTTETLRASTSFEAYSSVLVNMIGVIGLFVLQLFIEWKFSVACMGLALILHWLFEPLNRKTKTISVENTKIQARLNQQTIQAVHGYKYLKATDTFYRLLKRMLVSNSQLAGHRFLLARNSAIISALGEPLAVAGAISLVFAYSRITGASILSLMVVLLMLYRITTRFTALQSLWQQFCGNIGYVEAVRSGIDEFEAAREPTGAAQVAASGPAEISIENVTYRYGSGGGDVFSGLSLLIPKNQTVAFVGRSGAGKSTLVDLVTGLLEPQAGVVLINGRPIKEFGISAWRERIGYVTQEPVIFDDTVKNNISLWDNRDGATVDAGVRKAGEAADCLGFIGRLSNGFDTVVGDRGLKLSGGQRQRLFLARELFKEPALLILDEATSALDPETERTVQEAVDRMRGKATILVIAHRLSTVRNADMVYVLDRGRVVESGKYHELMKREGSALSKIFSEL